METTEKTIWINLPEDEKLTILSNIAEEKGIKENAVEKDFWVSMVLKAMFSLEYSDNLVFKGGTSLSKGWGLIERFSEDCDLAIDRKYLGFGEELSRKDRTRLRKKSKEFIENTLSKDLNVKLEELGLAGKFKINIPEVKESDKDPEESFAHPKFSVPTVISGRTFLEKVFLLHEEFNRPGGCTRLDRLTRHMYDIEKMMDRDFAKEAMNDSGMYEEIVKHRQSLTAWSGLDYKLHKPSAIDFIPDETTRKELEKDYSKMQESFIYGQSLSYEELIARLKELQERFRSLTWEKESEFFKEEN